jgi:hypothetical protein
VLSTCCKLKQECSLIGVLPKLPFFWIERGELFLKEHSSGNASVGHWECLCTIIELSQSKSHGTFSFLMVISYSSSDEQLREFGILYLGLENANSPFPTSVRYTLESSISRDFCFTLSTMGFWGVVFSKILALRTSINASAASKATSTLSR